MRGRKPAVVRDKIHVLHRDKKESPNKGTETLGSDLLTAARRLIKKESPNEGTETN